MELCTLLVQTGGLVPDCIICSTASCSRVLVFSDPLSSLLLHHLLPWQQCQLSSLCGESGHLVHSSVVRQPCRSPQPRYERLLAPQPRYSRAGSPGSPSKSTDEPLSTGPFLVFLVLRTVSQDPAEVTSAASSASRCSKISMFERQLKKP